MGVKWDNDLCPALKPPCPGRPWPMPQGQSAAQPASCWCRQPSGVWDGFSQPWMCLAPSPHPCFHIPSQALGLGKEERPSSGSRAPVSGKQLPSAAFSPRSWCQADAASAPGKTPGVPCGAFLSGGGKTDFNAAGRDPATGLCLLWPGCKTDACLALASAPRGPAAPSSWGCVSGASLYQCPASHL